MSDHPFVSLESFQHAYTSGLSNLLQEGGLGPFILVCANASFDKRVEAATAEGLAALYRSLSAEYVDALSKGKPINVVEEDLLVFLKLHAVGFKNLQATETRHAGPWEVQFNQLRSFRPKRITTQVPQTLHVPFDEASFHFNKPFMQKEAFWAGKLCGHYATLYYNKYPFADFHGLLVPERESCLPQFLTEAHHCYVWEVTQEMSLTLDGVLDEDVYSREQPFDGLIQVAIGGDDPIRLEHDCGGDDERVREAQRRTVSRAEPGRCCGDRPRSGLDVDREGVEELIRQGDCLGSTSVRGHQALGVRRRRKNQRVATVPGDPEGLDRGGVMRIIAVQDRDDHAGVEDRQSHSSRSPSSSPFSKTPVRAPENCSTGSTSRTSSTSPGPRTSARRLSPVWIPA